MNESIKSVSQSVNQSIKQSIEQLINKSADKPIETDLYSAIKEPFARRTDARVCA